MLLQNTYFCCYSVHFCGVCLHTTPSSPFSSDNGKWEIFLLFKHQALRLLASKILCVAVSETKFSDKLSLWFPSYVRPEHPFYSFLVLLSFPRCNFSTYCYCSCIAVCSSVDLTDTLFVGELFVCFFCCFLKEPKSEFMLLVPPLHTLEGRQVPTQCYY